MKHSRAFIEKQKAGREARKQQRIQAQKQQKQQRLEALHQRGTERRYSTAKEVQRERNQANKRFVLSFYGVDGYPECVRCGFKDIRALSIDHIDSDGAEHRRELGTTGLGFYIWLIDNDFPDGFQTLCMNCQFIKRQSELGFKEQLV